MKENLEDVTILLIYYTKITKIILSSPENANSLDLGARGYVHILYTYKHQ